MQATESSHFHASPTSAPLHVHMRPLVLQGVSVATGTPKSASRPSPAASTPGAPSSTGTSSAGSPSPGQAKNVDEDGWETVTGKKPAKLNKRQQPRGYQGRR